MKAAIRPAARVVVVGTVNVDSIWRVSSLPQPGQTILADSTDRQFGGKGANQAVAAARIGAPVVLVGAVGDDANGRMYREHLERQGVVTARLQTAAGSATGSAHVYVDPRGENLIVVDPGANRRLTAAAVRDALGQDLGVSDVVVAQLEAPLNGTLAALSIANRAGAWTILNASPVNPSFPWGAPGIDVVVVNAHECAAWFNQTPAALQEMTPADLAGLLQPRGIRHLVVTRGGDSTLHFSREERHVVPAHPVTPVDTVGAGDTFAGVLAVLLARRSPWRECLRLANIAAALSTLQLGAQSAMPDWAAVRNASKQFSSR